MRPHLWCKEDTKLTLKLLHSCKNIVLLLHISVPILYYCWIVVSIFAFVFGISLFLVLFVLV